jgi:hypothetical protein
MSMFELVREQITPDRPVVLFLDALDEFNGSPETIADFLSSFSPSTGQQKTLDIKICFSSRPWDVFVERFDKCRGIRLQDWTRPDISRYAAVRLRKILDPAPLDPTSEATQSHLTRMVNYIHENAHGVFLWVTLVLKELTELSHRSPQSLYAEMTKFPADLEDYYRFTLGRISPEDKHDAFVLLELVLRCEEGQVEVRDLYHAFICVKCATFEACQQLLLIAYSEAQEESSMVTQLKDLCGGLLEVVQVKEKIDQGVKHVVQFMHETTTEFVHRPGLLQCLACNSGLALVWANGHHFWTKYWFASATSFTHVRRIGDQRIGELLCTHSCLAEYTTGSHFGTFLDTVPEGFFNCQRSDCFECQRGEDTKFWISSRRSFAAISGLQLYISHKLANKAKDNSDDPALLLNSDQPSPLAHMICSEVNRRWRFRDVIRTTLDSSLTATLRILIHHGLWVNTRVSGELPLERLLRHSPGYMRNTEDLLPEILKVLLSAGCSPETPLNLMGLTNFKVFDRGSSPSACRPLHATFDARLTRVLLDYHADPDSLDEEGHTPLDDWVAWFNYNVIESRSAERSPSLLGPLQNVSLLIEAGGHLTQDGYKDFLRGKEAWLPDREPKIGSPKNYLKEKFVALMETAPLLQNRPTTQELKAMYRKSTHLSTCADLDMSSNQSSKPKSLSLQDRFRRLKP